MSGFSVDLHIYLTIGWVTVHGCGALYCELDVRVDCIEIVDCMEIVKLCRLSTRI